MIHDTLAAYAPRCVIEGEARGADTIGREAADVLMIPVLRYPANWAQFGKAAGPRRNQEMLDKGKPDLVCAFHDDLKNSKGTKDMIRRARQAGIEVRHFSHWDNGTFMTVIK